MKHHLRKEMRQALARISPADAAEKSHQACAKLTGLEQFAAADVVMLYLPIPGEVDAVPIALAAWRHDKTVLVPKVDWQQRHMLAVECRSLSDEMVRTRFGLRQPRDGHPWPVEDIDLVVVPALAFDRQGSRLGRGGGFYDRFLSHRKARAATCGLAFEEQVVDALPAAAHDRPVDMLVTDHGVRMFNGVRPGGARPK